MYELIIAGGGPAGCAAAVYAGRKKIKTLLITKDFGGQSIVSDDIGNWIGDVSISGIDLAMRLEKHVRSQADITVKTARNVVQVRVKQASKTFPLYEIETD